MNYEKVIKDNEKLIWKITNYFYGIDKNDLYQAGVMGLLKALKNYKVNNKTKFSTYAYDYIYGEMYLLASNRDIKVSKDILKLYRKIEYTRYVLAQKMAKLPSNQELSKFLNISIDDINMACASAKEILSLDYTYDDNADIYNSVGSEDNTFDKVLINDGLQTLTEDEKEIIKSRYYEDLTQAEVARKLNMTQVMVSRYEKRSIDKMRNYLTM